MKLGNYAVALLIDVEEAFSHTSPQIICEEAASRGVLRPVVKWIMALLATRKVTSNLGSYRCSGTVSTGNPRDFTAGLKSGGRRAALVAERSWVSFPGLRGRLCCGNSQHRLERCSQTHAVQVKIGNQLVLGDGAQSQPGQNGTGYIYKKT